MDFSINNSEFNKDSYTWKKAIEPNKDALIDFHVDFASNLFKKANEQAKKIIS